MRGKKILLAKILEACGLMTMASSPERLHVLCYHRIAQDDYEIEGSLFDSGVYGCTLDTFMAQLKYLKKHTTIINLNQLLLLMRGEHIGNGPYSMVTFDDAYIDCHTLAFEVLDEMEIPAMVFVPSKLIDEGRLGWWDLLAYILKHAKVDKLIWDGVEFDPISKRDAVISYFLKKMKQEPFESNQNLIQDVAKACKVELPSREEQASQLMNWAQLREISEGVFEIGAHTHTHRVLTTLTPEEQHIELCESKRVIEDNIGKQVRALAYPVGGLYCFDEVTKMAAKDCGYEVAFSFGTGTNPNADSLDPFNICRFEPAQDISLLAGQCVFPKIFL